ncbi:MAG: phosphatase PAP2 family protein [Bdellovibrionaceae bacterium]|nr:phosphatase PAP2 family protein [Pseudobdellovibrionaceae bacterium]
MYANKSALIKYNLRFLAVVGFLSILSILFIDQNLTLLFKNDDWVWLLAREITHVGLFTNYFIPAFIVWFGLQIFLKWSQPKNRDRLKQITTKALWLMYSLLFSGLCVHIFKFLVGRQRPKISPDFDPHVFQPFTTHWDFHSMPSGHSQVLFTVATYFAYLFPRFKYGIYSVAFILAFTRVMTRDHFYSDVLMGLAVGHLSTAVMLYWLSRRKMPAP